MAEYISREEVMNVIANMKVEHHYDAANLEDRYIVAHLLEVADKIKDLKAADIQPVKRGKWELTNNSSFRKCSECGAWWSSNFTDGCFTNYCPRCGARMDGDAE